MTSTVRVVIADDSAAMRTLLRTVFAEDPRTHVVGEARDGVEAVELARRLQPDVISMDVRMPRLDGLGATSTIMREAPCRILVVSALADREQAISLAAVGAGALEVIAKPSVDEAGSTRQWAERVREAVLLMSEVPVVRRRTSVARGSLPRATSGVSVDVVGIAASTGGPPALAELLAALPAELPVPVLIAQHMTPGFVDGLRRWLESVTRARVSLASPGVPARAGAVYLAPDRMDLSVDAEGLLVVTPSAGGPCPSGDHLLGSLARAYGSRALGVVLTGMGEDGARGAQAIERAGGLVALQDEATSVVYGMPSAAGRLCRAARVFPLEHMGPFIASSCTRPAPGAESSDPSR